MNVKSKFKLFFEFIILLIFYSLSSVMSKFASAYSFLSLGWIVWYAAGIMFLALYAIIWQQVLKRMDLGIAYSLRSLTIVMGIIYGHILFSEEIDIKKIVGSVAVIWGTILISRPLGNEE